MAGASRRPHHNMSAGQRGSTPKGQRGRRDTRWDGVADWYDGWTGPDGSIYHRPVAFPVTLDTLHLKPGEHVLGLGAGQGVLAPQVHATGATYPGLDLSPRRIELARKRHGHHGTFLALRAIRQHGNRPSRPTRRGSVR